MSRWGGDTAVLDRSTEKEVQRAVAERRKRVAKEAELDRMLESDEFNRHLTMRGLEILPTTPLGLYSGEMEQCALGAMMMLSDRAVTQGMARLNTRMFYLPVHRTICGAILQLAAERLRGAAPGLVQIDFATVGDVLARRGLLGAQVRTDPNGLQPVDPVYLMGCVEGTPSAENIDFYIDRVVWWSKRRHLGQLSGELRRRSGEPDCEPSRIAAFAVNAAQAINDRGWCDFDAAWENTK